MIVGLFGKDVSEVSAEFRDQDFFGFFSHGNFSGDSDFVDMFLTQFWRGRVLMKSPLNPLGISSREQMSDLIVWV